MGGRQLTTRARETIRVRSGRPLPAEWLDEAGTRGLAHVTTLQFPSMVYAGEENMFLASVKAASDIYAPISGEVVAINEDLEDVLADHVT